MKLKLTSFIAVTAILASGCAGNGVVPNSPQTSPRIQSQGIAADPRTGSVLIRLPAVDTRLSAVVTKESASSILIGLPAIDRHIASSFGTGVRSYDECPQFEQGNPPPGQPPCWNPPNYPPVILPPPSGVGGGRGGGGQGRKPRDLSLGSSWLNGVFTVNCFNYSILSAGTATAEGLNTRGQTFAGTITIPAGKNFSFWIPSPAPGGNSIIITVTGSLGPATCSGTG